MYPGTSSPLPSADVQPIGSKRSACFVSFHRASISEKTARDIEVRLRRPKGSMDWVDGKAPTGEVPYTVSGRQLSPREEIIMDLICALTPEQQEELLPVLRATFDANRATQKLLSSGIKTVGNRRIEAEFGRPGEKVKGKS